MTKNTRKIKKNKPSRPITVGILSIPMTASHQKITHSYLPSSYVKWIEMNNADVIPIPYDTSKGTLDMILNQVNGILFIGGQIDHGMLNTEYIRFIETFKYIVNHAKKSNNLKNYFPLFAICLGFEVLGMMNHDAQTVIDEFTTLKGLSNVNAHHYNSKLNITKPDSKFARIFTTQQQTEFEKTQCVFQNHSQAFVINKPYMKKWNKYWDTVATSKSKDKIPIEYVSMLEYKKYPFYGVQFHPEKILFEWLLPEIGRSAIFRNISKQLGHFFINECKKNKNKTNTDELFIRNYNLWARNTNMSKLYPNNKLNKKNRSFFENSYYFNIL